MRGKWSNTMKFDGGQTVNRKPQGSVLISFGFPPADRCGFDGSISFHAPLYAIDKGTE
jgi:hypothetical protein